MSFGVNIKAGFIFVVEKGVGCFYRGTNAGIEKIKEASLKKFVKECIVERFDNLSKAIIRETAFRHETVDTWIPYQ